MRTDMDWSGHELIITDTEGLLTHYLKKPGTLMDAVMFINTNGVLVVTGDYSNWMFDREFHPSKGGFVQDTYWAEKLKQSSTQVPYEFDPEGTADTIIELLQGEDITESEREYLEECLSLSDSSKFDYERIAYRENVGRYQDYERIPYEDRIVRHLLVVFDAFEEICKRL